MQFKTVVIVTLMLFSRPLLAQQDMLWTNAGGDSLWSNASNWSPTNLPSFDNGSKVFVNSSPGPIVSSGIEGDCQWLVLGDDAAADLTVNGDLFVFDFVTWTNDNWFIIGNNSSASGTLTINSGTVRTGTGSTFYLGYKGQGIVRINGGTLDIWGLLGIGYCDTGGYTTGAGYLYLNSGTVTAYDLIMAYPQGCTGLLDIAEGTLIISGDNTSLINGYIADGKIVAYGGTGVLAVDYDITNPGMTTVKAVPNPEQASKPNPGYNSMNVPLDVNLTWTPGQGATSHTIYFGTTSPGTLKGSQDSNSFNPILNYNTTYYWRVDEVIGANTVTGLVWKFTTTEGKAVNPDPADNGPQNVAIDKILHWTAGSSATSHDIYFGTDAAAVSAAQRLAGDLDASGKVDYKDFSILINHWLMNPAESVPYAGTNEDNIVNYEDYAILLQNWMGQSNSAFKGNVADTSYDPALVPEMNYYWRVDERNGSEVSRGDVWTFTTKYTLIGKVMCGYQGWFNCTGDGSNPAMGWRHWPDSGTTAPTPTNIHVDMWPDMTEMTAGEKFEATAFVSGSSHYYLFSSHNVTTVRRHFQWMQDYGIDGVYLQRFASEVRRRTDASFFNRNEVLDYCKSGANMYGRKYAVMYDLSGLGSGRMQSVIDDWKYLLDTKRVTRDPNDYAYMRHRGKPVVAVWGIGWNDSGHTYSWSECVPLINFLKDDPTYGGNIVMIGVQQNWRSNLTDPSMLAMATKADIISPWSVGSFALGVELTTFTNNVWLPDMQWCKDNSTPTHPIEYLPVIWPGFSWQNMHYGEVGNYPLNQIPRNGGQFLWNQLYATVSTVRCSMLYIAMFDEVDEGTAIFKITNNPPRPGGVDMFVTPDFDGYPLPSDEYLWLTGQAGQALRGEIPLNPIRPTR